MRIKGSIEGWNILGIDGSKGGMGHDGGSSPPLPNK